MDIYDCEYVIFESTYGKFVDITPAPMNGKHEPVQSWMLMEFADYAGPDIDEYYVSINTGDTRRECLELRNWFNSTVVYFPTEDEDND